MIIKQGVLPNVRLGDDVGVWESSIVYKVLYFMLKAETIVDLMARFLMEVAIFVEVPSRRYIIRHRCGVWRFDESFRGQIFICLGKGHSKVENFWTGFLCEVWVG